MGLLGCQPPGSGEVDCDVVDEYIFLEFLLDADLSFAPMLRGATGKSHAQFLEVVHTAETGGFSVPILTCQVPVRVEPGLLFMAPLLALAPRIEATMDKLQASWARVILGCEYGHPVSWALLRAQCGWTPRLSSRIWEAAIVALARLAVLPPSHPGARMVQCALASTATTWVSSVKSFMSSDYFSNPISGIAEHPAFSEELLAEATWDVDARKALLRQYRLEDVQPALQALDMELVQRAAATHMCVTPLLVADVLTGASWDEIVLLGMDWGPKTWKLYRMWSLVRITGCWPLTCYGVASLPPCLPQCSLCGTEGVRIIHALGECTVTAPVSTTRLYAGSYCSSALCLGGRRGSE